ncbi:hypothetical protein QZH41_018444 [Actinostola sp. cb2023]|nr:hypothetical protein QZH41_018444 [Actinostola sp. cb2023]
MTDWPINRTVLFLTDGRLMPLNVHKSLARLATLHENSINFTIYLSLYTKGYFTMQNIIVDNGTGIFKAGIAGDDKPRVVLQNVVGKSAGSELYGNEAIGKRNELNLSYPMEHGAVTNWEDMEKFWKHAFGKLDVDLENHRVVMTEMQNENRAKTAEVRTHV